MEIRCGKLDISHEKKAPATPTGEVWPLHVWMGWLAAAKRILLEELNRDTKTVVVADGSENLDNWAIISEQRGADYVLFFKTGQGEKVKQVKAMQKRGLR